MRIDWKKFKNNLEPSELAGNFFQGLLILVPLVVTVYVLLFLFKVIDGWLNLPIPGLGFLISVAAITLAGRFASNVAVQTLLDRIDHLLGKAPLIKLLYNSLKDLVAAFMGERRRFEQAVLVQFGDNSDSLLVGFITRKDLAFLGLPGRTAVYIPHAYNISGHVVLLPRERIKPLNIPSAEMMSFVVSGGVAGGGGVAPENTAQEGPSEDSGSAGTSHQ